jgi:hypothetical protein
MVEKSSLNFDLKRRRKNLWLFIVNENQSKDVHLPKMFPLGFLNNWDTNFQSGRLPIRGSKWFFSNLNNNTESLL